MVQQLLGYLDRLSGNVEYDPQLTTDIAAAYERVAQLQGDPYSVNMGMTREALDTYDKALALRSALSEQDPEAVEPLYYEVRCRTQRASSRATGTAPSPSGTSRPGSPCSA